MVILTMWKWALRTALVLALVTAGCGGGSEGGDDGSGSGDTGSGSGDGDGDTGSGSGDGDGDGGDGDGDGPLQPRLIPGGGVDNGPINGVVHVYAIDAASGAPLSGAAVTIGGTELTTDGSGLATFEDSGLQGAQTVTATASGYAATSFVGANGGNVTLGLDKRQIDTAMLTGSISNWGQLGGSVSIGGDYVLGVILNSSPPILASVGAATVDQPVDMDNVPLNTCVRTVLDSGPCNWTVMARRGGMTVPFALILQGNTNGTNNDISDDVYELLGYAIGTPVDAGSNQNGLNLTAKRKQDLDLTQLSVAMPASTGLEAEIAVPYIDLGARGQLVFPFPVLDASNTRIELPSLSGDFAGGEYQVAGVAVNDDNTVSSTSIVRGASGTAQLPGWLDRAGSLSASASGFSFSPVGDAEFHVGTYLDGNGSPLWRVIVLDPSGDVTLPSAASGASALRLTAFDVAGFDVGDFSLADVDVTVSRASDVQTSVR